MLTNDRIIKHYLMFGYSEMVGNPHARLPHTKSYTIVREFNGYYRKSFIDRQYEYAECDLDGAENEAQYDKIIGNSLCEIQRVERVISAVTIITYDDGEVKWMLDGDDKIHTTPLKSYRISSNL